MDQAIRDEYERLKALGVPTRRALAGAKARAADPIPEDLKELDPDEGSIKVERGKFTVHVKVEYDRDLTPDDVGLGRFVSEDEDGAIKRPSPGRDEYKYFIPNYSLKERIRDYREAGLPKGQANDKAREGVFEDLRQAETMGEDWSPLVVIAEVFYKGIELCVDALGSVTLADRDDPYLFDVARDVIAEALAGAEEALAELRKDEENGPTTLQVAWDSGLGSLSAHAAETATHSFKTRAEALAYVVGVEDALLYANGYLQATAVMEMAPTNTEEA